MMKRICNLKITNSLLILCILCAVLVNIATAAQKKLDQAIHAAQKANMTESEINRVLVYGYDIRVSAIDVIELLEILTEVRNNGFSIDRLLTKIDEGLAKRVSFIVLKSYLKKKQRDYIYVLELYRRTGKNTEIQKGNPALIHVADSIDFGLTHEEIESLVKGISNVPVEMYAIAAMNAAFLKQLGFDSLLTINMMRAGLEHRRFSKDWEFFFKTVEMAQKSGASDKAIFEATMQMLKDGKKPKDVLKKLGLKGQNSEIKAADKAIQHG